MPRGAKEPAGPKNRPQTPSALTRGRSRDPTSAHASPPVRHADPAQNAAERSRKIIAYTRVLCNREISLIRHKCRDHDLFLKFLRYKQKVRAILDKTPRIVRITYEYSKLSKTNSAKKCVKSHICEALITRKRQQMQQHLQNFECKYITAAQIAATRNQPNGRCA